MVWTVQDFVSIIMSIGVMSVILVLCGCCCIPCLRTLAIRLITTALTKEWEELKGQFMLADVTVPLLIDKVDEEASTGENDFV